MQVDGIHDDSMVITSDSDESQTPMLEQQTLTRDELVSLV